VSSGREDAFRDGVRARDGKCVITGEVGIISIGSWVGFQAAHVFPREYQYNGITNMASGSSTINSTQNGLLMRSDIHTLFDQYLFSINPDVSFPKFISAIPILI
jgi:hypothetical protein